MLFWLGHSTCRVILNASSDHMSKGRVTVDKIVSERGQSMKDQQADQHSGSILMHRPGGIRNPFDPILCGNDQPKGAHLAITQLLSRETRP